MSRPANPEFAKATKHIRRLFRRGYVVMGLRWRPLACKSRAFVAMAATIMTIVGGAATVLMAVWAAPGSNRSSGFVVQTALVDQDWAALAKEFVQAHQPADPTRCWSATLVDYSPEQKIIRMDLVVSSPVAFQASIAASDRANELVRYLLSCHAIPPDSEGLDVIIGSRQLDRVPVPVPDSPGSWLYKIAYEW